MLFPCLAPAGGSEAPLWSLAVRLKPVVSCHFCGHDSAPYRSIRSLCFRSLLSLWQHFLFWLEYCLNSNISAAPSAATPLEMVFHAFITPRVQLSGEWLLTTRRLPSKVGISLMVPFFFAEAALLFPPEVVASVLESNTSCGLRKRSHQSDAVKCCEQEARPGRRAQEDIWLRGGIVKLFSSHCCGELSESAWFTLKTGEGGNDTQVPVEV